MRPKNRVFCNLAGRPKMLFETEEKALRFLKFNTNNEDDWKKHKVPIRAYYCSSCMGWHLTSHRNYNKTLEDDEKYISSVISSYQQQLKAKSFLEIKTDLNIKTYKKVNTNLNDVLYKVGCRRNEKLSVEELDELKEEVNIIERDYKTLELENEELRQSIIDRIHLARERIKVGYLIKEVRKMIAQNDKNKLIKIKEKINNLDEITVKKDLKSILHDIRIFESKIKEN